MWSRQYLQQQNQIAARNMSPYVAFVTCLLDDEITDGSV